MAAIVLGFLVCNGICIFGSADRPLLHPLCMVSAQPSHRPSRRELRRIVDVAHRIADVPVVEKSDDV